MSSPSRRLAQVIRHPPLRVLLAIAALAVVAVALVGGLRGTRGKTLATHGAGAVIDAGALELTPLRAWISDVRPGRDRPSSFGPSERYLVLQVLALNRSDSSQAGGFALHNSILWLPVLPGEGIRPESVSRSDDHGTYYHLPPLLPTEIDLVWVVPADWTPDAETQWGVRAVRFKSRTWLTGGSEWLPAEQLAKLVLPLEEQRAMEAGP